MICGALGALGAWVYNKFHAMEIWEVLGFFKGKRLVPIMSIFCSIPLGLLLAHTWPYIQYAISATSILINQDMPIGLSTFLMGFGERALIPFGLHHLLYSPFWFMFGDYTNAAGQLIHGDQTITMAMLADGVKNFSSSTYDHAGFFMQGEYPLMLLGGGFTGACVAIYQSVPKSQKKSTLGYLISVLLPCNIMGVTEGVEFMYVWTSRKLWLFSAFMAGLNYMTLALFHVHIAKSFSAGLLDFVQYGVIPSVSGGFQTGWATVIPITFINFIIYFFVFKFAIKRGEKIVLDDKKAKSPKDIAEEIIPLLGGYKNIKTIDSCATRLRLILISLEGIDDESLLALGAKGKIVRPGGTALQLIFGNDAQVVERIMNENR